VCLEKLESDILNNLIIKPIFYYRFVDNIALAAPCTYVDNLLRMFNSFHPRLKFMMEIGGNTLNFLDLILIKKDNYLLFNWFHKPIFSSRFLNYNSQHLFTHKKGTIISLVDRVITLSHPDFHKENFDSIIKILIDNGYLRDLIFSTIRKRLYLKFNHSKQKKHSQIINIHTSEREIYFTIPYFSFIANKFIQYFKNISFCKLAFTCYNKFNKYIKIHKDPLSVASHANVTHRM